MGRTRPAVVLAFGLILVAHPAQQAGGAHAPLGVVATLAGDVRLSRADAQPPVPLQYQDPLHAGDTLIAATGSMARLLIGGHASVTLRERSGVTLAPDAGGAAMDLQHGVMTLWVVPSRITPDSRVQVLTPHARVRTAHAALVIETSGSGDTALSTVYALRGSARVSLRASGTGSEVILTAPSKLWVNGQVVTAPRLLEAEESWRLHAMLTSSGSPGRNMVGAPAGDGGRSGFSGDGNYPGAPRFPAPWGPPGGLQPWPGPPGPEMYSRPGSGPKDPARPPGMPPAFTAPPGTPSRDGSRWGFDRDHAREPGYPPKPRDRGDREIGGRLTKPGSFMPSDVPPRFPLGPPRSRRSW